MRPLGSRRRNNQIAKVAEINTGDGKDPQKVERAVSAIATKINEMLGGGVYAADVDLVTGDNIIQHGLMRRASLVQVTPKTASAGFAWGWDPEQSGNARPLLTTKIVVVGGPMAARVVVE